MPLRRACRPEAPWTSAAGESCPLLVNDPPVTVVAPPVWVYDRALDWKPAALAATLFNVRLPPDVPVEPGPL